MESRSESLAVVALWHGRASMSDDSDLTVVPTDWLEIRGNLSYTKTKYTKWDNLNALGAPVSYASAPFSPKILVLVCAVSAG